VRVILRNRAYLGYCSAGGVEHEGVHEPLVSRETWEDAAGQRERHTPPAAPSQPRPASWAGLLRCARCGRKLWFKHGGDADSRSYRCAGATKGACSATQFRAELIERAICDLVELLAVEDIHQLVTGVYVEEGEILFLSSLPTYTRLLERLGYRVSEPPTDTPKPPAGAHQV